VFRRDRSGIVAAVTGVLADDRGNVEDTSLDDLRRASLRT
jgi:predicted amino acid-binding ACT domain protein